MKGLKDFLKNIPAVGTVLRIISKSFRRIIFKGSQEYWEARYSKGGTSGPGSFNELARFKAEVLNDFVRDKNIGSVIEFGCGDGNQLSLADYASYTGLDVSRTAIRLCKERFALDKTKSFFLYDPDSFMDNSAVFEADLSLSLDVIYHLIEDRIFVQYMNHLFSSAKKFVIIYSSDIENRKLDDAHVKHRKFSKWVSVNYPDWSLMKTIKNEYRYGEGDNQKGSLADFFIYQRHV